MGCVQGKSTTETEATSPGRGSKPKTSSVGGAEEATKNGFFGFLSRTAAAATGRSGTGEIVLGGADGFEESRVVEEGEGDELSSTAMSGSGTGADIIGLSRISRISAQYLPPSGSRVARVPGFNFELRYSYLTQRGYYPEALDKANQDSFCIHTQFGNEPDDHFFGVFDGHGEFGTQCSQFARESLCKNLLKDRRRLRTDVVQAFHSAFLATNTQLHRGGGGGIDDSMSGTTGITALVRGQTLFVANVGDSRAVLAEFRPSKNNSNKKELVAVDLSSDQTPFRSDECARVRLCGARVLTLDQLEGLKNPNIQCWGDGEEEEDDGDPPRLWVANGVYPGTAFTRSIGDKIAEQIGVIAVPEVLVMELTSNHPFFILASDGVFEFLSSQAVVDMVAKYNDPRDACAAIVAESYRLWLQYETRTDDITVIVVQIKGLQDEKEDIVEANMAKQPESEVEQEKSSSSPSEGWRPVVIRSSRHDSCGARLRTIEASLHHAAIWEPPSVLHPKNNEELIQIDQALQGNFLFNGLTEKQKHLLFECTERMRVKAGEVIMRQGLEDDCFYIVETGRFEVLVSQDGMSGGSDLGMVISHYSSNDCFGDLALMYNKPRQASVRAVTDGSLWVLRREVFRGVLSVKYSHHATLKTLQQIDIFSHLNATQLHHMLESFAMLSFKDGDVLVDKESELSALFVICQGAVQLSIYKEEVDAADNEIILNEVRKEGSCFGEWVLLNESPRKVTAVACGDVECWTITKEKFEAAVGSLQQIIQEDTLLKEKLSSLLNAHSLEVDVHEFQNIQISDLEWEETVYHTDCCEVGLVLKKGTDKLISMKRYSKKVVAQLGRENAVLREKYLFLNLSPSLFIPQVLHTCADEEYATLLLNCRLVGPLALILHSPLDEVSTRFIAASLVTALISLHKDGVIYRGISPDVLMLDERGLLQLVDFRFAKKLTSDRTFTICGMTDFLAPEMIKGQGHNFSVDWWALGVLIYFMLENELPFGTWRETELDIYARIARRQLVFPSNFSTEVVDLLNRLLVVDEGERLGLERRGTNSIKNHAWFSGLDWGAFLDGHPEAPAGVLSRLNLAVEQHHTSNNNPHWPDTGARMDGNDTFWLDDW